MKTRRLLTMPKNMLCHYHHQAPPLPIVLIVDIWKISKNKSLHFTFICYVFILLKSFNRWVISLFCCSEMIKIYQILYVLYYIDNMDVLKYISFNLHANFRHVEFKYDGVLSFYLSNFFTIWLLIFFCK